MHVIIVTCLPASAYWIDHHNYVYRRTCAYLILDLIKEEETQSDLLKRSANTSAIVAAADSIDSTGVAAEQAFNREQVQGNVQYSG